MVGAFSIFATLPILDMKEMGIGLASAVLIDATIVRGVLLPASMKLLGKWNWYLPYWLGWLPKLEHHAEPSLQPGYKPPDRRSGGDTGPGPPTRGPGPPLDRKPAWRD